MDLNRRVYRLSPSQFSAETIAVTFAKTSRSPEAFDVIAAGGEVLALARGAFKLVPLNRDRGGRTGG